MRYSIAIFSMTLGFSLAGCERSSDKPTGASKPPAATSAKPKDDHGHKPGEGAGRGDKDESAHRDEPKHKDEPARKDEASPAGHGGEVIALGTTKIGDFEVRASRHEAEFKPGGDAPIDVWIDGGVGKGVTVVRFWIGAQDAKGSIKAKADIEDGKWHTHVEIPSPMPAESRLWVEVEESGGKKTVGSFDLKI